MAFAMPRTARAAVGGLCYHVLNRGNGRATVFHDPSDYQAFVALLNKARERLPMRLLAYCMMPNHFHLVLWPHQDGDLGRWMQWLLTSHVQGELQQILSLPDAPAAETPLSELGMDSLMAVELVQAIEERFGVNVPIMAVTEGASVAQMAARLAVQLTGGDAAATGSGGQDAHRYQNKTTDHFPVDLLCHDIPSCG